MTLHWYFFTTSVAAPKTDAIAYVCKQLLRLVFFAAGSMSRSGPPVPLKYLVMQSLKGDVQYGALQPRRSAGHNGIWSVRGVACSLCPSVMVPFYWRVCVCVAVFIYV